MKVLILAGGYGSRLRNLPHDVPKPMVAVGDKPILWHIMKIYSCYGFNDFVIMLGYQGVKIKEYFINYNLINNDFTVNLADGSIEYLNRNSGENWKVTLVDTGRDTLKGGRIKRIEKFLDHGTNMITYGDGVADIDIKDLVSFHKSHGKILTLSGVRPPSRFGEIKTENNRLLAFEEKPQTSSGMINGGFMVFNKGLLDYLSPDDDCDFEFGVLEDSGKTRGDPGLSAPRFLGMRRYGKGPESLEQAVEGKPGFLEDLVSRESQMAFRDAYRGLKVLVTGHTGFKGSWLSVWLASLGAEVFGVALEPRSDRDNFVAAGLRKRVNHTVCDIRNRDALMDIVGAVKPDVAFHLAAQPIVSESFANPAETFETNLMGTVNILEAIRHTDSIKSAVLITSDKCYRNVERERGYRETDVLGGWDPYGASKSCAEIAIDSYRASFFQNPGSPRIASVRAGNVIGGGDWSDNRIVPDIVRALAAGVPVELRCPGATRPWLFVLEPLSGYLWLGANMLEGHDDFASCWNFGPDERTAITVEELAKKIVDHWGSGSIKKDFPGGSDFHEAVRLTLDCSKARHQLKWRPALTMNETVDFTISWYKCWEKDKDMFAFDTNTIKRFSDKAAGEIFHGQYIAGVTVAGLKRFPDKRGVVMHIMKATDPAFTGFGEVYCSSIYPGMVKGWHVSENTTVHYVADKGHDKIGAV